MMRRHITGIALALVLGAAGLLVATSTAALTIIYDFGGVAPGTGPHTASDGEVDQTDANIAAGSFPAGRTGWGADWANWAEASAGEYAALTASDDIYYQTVSNPGWGDNVAHLFEFTVAENPADVTDILFSVEVSRARTTDTQFFYLWNDTNAQYTVLGNIDTGSTDFAATNYSLVNNVPGIDATNIGDYVDGSGQVTLLTINQDSGGFFGGARWQRFDFLEMTVVSVPEPKTAVLLAFGLLGLVLCKRPRSRFPKR
jgi:hypothetical protein